MKTLICIDASDAAHAAARLVTRLCFPIESKIVLLGVIEGGIKRVKVATFMKHIIQDELKGFKNIEQKFISIG